jgi:hypothetical protein
MYYISIDLPANDNALKALLSPDTLPELMTPNVPWKLQFG